MPPGIALFHTGLGGNAGLRVTDRVPYALSYVHTDILNAMQSEGPRRWGLEESERPGCVLFCWTVDGWLVVGVPSELVCDGRSGLSGLGKGCVVTRLVGGWKDELEQRSQLLDGGGG